MELSFSKLAMVGIVLVALGIVSVAFMRAYSQYTEAHLYMSKLSSKASSKTVEILACYTNTTYRMVHGTPVRDHNYTAIHFYNYGDSNYSDRITIYYSETGDNLSLYFNGTKYTLRNGTLIKFLPKRLLEVDVNLTDIGQSYSDINEDYDLVVMWLESGDVEVVRCHSP